MNSVSANGTSSGVVASVIIPVRNEEQNIRRCLEGILAQQVDFDFEVIVIDSGSTDKTLEILRSYPVRVLEIPPHEFHHGRTRNLGAEQARGGLLVYTSADAFPAGNLWLQNLTAPFADRTVGAVFGRQLAKPDATPERRFFMQHRYGDAPAVKSAQNRAKWGYRYWQFSTVNGAIRRDVWQQTKFPEDLNAYEDIGISRKILDLGLKVVYEPSAAVYHSHNYPLWLNFKQYFDSGVVMKRLGMLNGETEGDLRDEGLYYLRQEMQYLIHEGHILRCPYVLLYEFSRYVALGLGERHEHVPQFLRKRWSSHRLFG